LRSSESYSEKWNYVRENPVRSEFVTSADGRPYSGEIERLEFQATVEEHAKEGGFPGNRISGVRSVIDPTTAERL
jgi:hypothetical protein